MEKLSEADFELNIFTLKIDSNISNDERALFNVSQYDKILNIINSESLLVKFDGFYIAENMEKLIKNYPNILFVVPGLTELMIPPEKITKRIVFRFRNYSLKGLILYENEHYWSISIIDAAAFKFGNNTSEEVKINYENIKNCRIMIFELQKD